MTAGLPVASLTWLVSLPKLRRQEGEGRDRDEHQRHRGGDEEAAVDRDEPVAVGGAQLRGQDADERADDADGADDQRQQQALGAERGLAQDQGGDQRDGVGLEQVGGHAGAVTHVVTDVVGDGGGVARVVLGDAGLDLADEVGADVGGLGEDAAADTHEHGEQGAAEAEALEHGRGVGVVGEEHDAGAEQAQADGEHADDAAGAERDVEAALAAAATGSRGDPDVGLGRERHADVADERGEDGADDEEQRPAELHGETAVVDRQHEQQDEDDDGEDREGAELPVQVGARAFLDGLRDLLHLRRALVGLEHLPHQRVREHERGDGDQSDHHHRYVFTGTDARLSDQVRGHATPLDSVRVARRPLIFSGTTASGALFFAMQTWRPALTGGV